MSVPSVEAVKTPSYTLRQSKYHPNVPTVPFRILCTAPSGSGKTSLLIAMLTDIYPIGKVFDRIYVFSHSVHIDDAWQPVRNALTEAKLPVEEHMFDSYYEDKIEEILATQKKIVEWQKNHKQKRLMQICIILDDMLDDHRAMRSSKTLERLAARGRHMQTSTIVSSQAYRSVMPVYRINTSDDIVFRISNRLCLEAIIDEFSALVGKKQFEALYRRAVSEPYSFLWINKRAAKLEDMFKMRFDKRLLIA